MYNPGEEIYNPDLGSTMVEGVPVPQAYSLGTSVELAVGFYNGSHFSFIETVKG